MLKSGWSRVVEGAVAAAILACAVGTTWALGNEPEDIVGTVVSVFKEVDVLPGGKGTTWVKGIQAGYKLHQQDELRTGQRGRARIEFADRYASMNSGPSVINVGSDSHLKLSEFQIDMDKSEQNSGILDLFRGAIRAFSKGWGGRAAFSVRTGTSLCGIRGSEEVVAFDPGTGGGPGHVTQSCLDGNCVTWGTGQFRSQEKKLVDGWQRLMPAPDPKTWKDVKLTAQRRGGLVKETGVPGVSDERGEEYRFDHRGDQGSSGQPIPPGGPWMGVRWTADGLPDCTAEVAELMLNTYRWDEIKDQRDFTFYRDELLNDRFVVSGMIQTQCPTELLQVEVSVDGGSSWTQARFSPEAGTFRYEFDPTGFSDLDLRVRPTFKKSLVEEYRSSVGLSQ